MTITAASLGFLACGMIGTFLGFVICSILTMAKISDLQEENDRLHVALDINGPAPTMNPELAGRHDVYPASW